MTSFCVRHAAPLQGVDRERVDASAPARLAEPPAGPTTPAPPARRPDLTRPGLARVAEITDVIVSILRQRPTFLRVVFRGEDAQVFATALRTCARVSPSVRAGVVVTTGPAVHPGGRPVAAAAAAAAAAVAVADRHPADVQARADLLIEVRSNPHAHRANDDLQHGAVRPAWPGRVPDLVIDGREPDWPVLQHVAAHLPYPDGYRLRETRAFFAVRAAGWDARFGDQRPAYAAAVKAAGLPAGSVVADIGCGSGTALPALQAAVGPTGRVLALDLTPEMLRAVPTATHQVGTRAPVRLLVGDALHLPLADAGLDAAFAAALFPHLPDPARALAELARVVRHRGGLIIFHPSGRAALAARHGHAPGPADPFARRPLAGLLRATGWRLDSYQDDARFLVLATRHAR